MCHDCCSHDVESNGGNEGENCDENCDEDCDEDYDEDETEIEEVEPSSWADRHGE